MLSPETAKALAGLIDMGSAMPVPPPAAGAIHKDTIYITVVDRDRMAVSLIYSVFWGFGSGLCLVEVRDQLPRNRGAASPCRKATRTRRAGASGRCTRSSPAWCAGAAA